MLSKIKLFVKIHYGEIILVVGAILISLLSFAMGYITAKEQEKQPIYFETVNFNNQNTDANPKPQTPMPNDQNEIGN